VSAIDALLRPIKQRLSGLVVKGVLYAAGDVFTQVEVQEGDVKDSVQRMAGYGFSSRPLDGAEALVLNVGGVNSPIIVQTDDRRYKLDLSKGEVAIHDDQGQKIVIGRSDVTITSKSGNDISIVAGGTGKILMNGASGTDPLERVLTGSAGDEVPAVRVYASRT
jgi:phage gp45-like